MSRAAVRRKGLPVGSVPLPEQKFPAHSRSDVIPGEHLVPLPGPGDHRHGIKTFLSERLLPDVESETFVPSVKTSSAAPGTLQQRATLPTAPGENAFQQGLRWRYSQLENACRRRSNELDRMFDFRPLLIDGRVLPPVIRWAGRSMSLHDESSATAVDATYRIIQPARIVSTAPIWEAYLLKDFDAFDGTLEVMPRTSDEKTSWRLGVEKGWDEGVAHADEVFDMNMARLVSDYRGMLRFKMLAKAGMLSIPVLAEGRLGVRVGDKTLDVNQTVFRITAPAGFRGSQHWTPGTSGKPE